VFLFAIQSVFPQDLILINKN